MSWDVYLTVDTGSPEPQCIGDAWNCTYNVAPMFYAALPIESGLRGLDGMPAAAAADALCHAIRAMEDDPAKYRAMNPANGWGSYESALEFLRNIHDACVEHPKCSVRVW